MEKVIDYYLCYPTRRHGHYLFFEKIDKEMVLHARYGCFITKIIDSGKTQMEWNDITIQYNEAVNSKIYVCISDAYDELIKVTRLTKSKQMQYIKQNANIVSTYHHALLYDDYTRGRYLICMVEIFAKQKQDIVIEEIHFTYPKINFVEYLPAIYHNQLFLEQYIAIYQSLYLDIEKESVEFVNQLDVFTADDTMLLFLATWLGMDSRLFKKEDLRRYVAMYAILHPLKGTKEYFEKLVEIYCGTRGYVIEYDDETCIYANNQVGKHVFSLDTHTFALLIPIHHYEDKRYVEEMILKEVPLTLTCKIIWLDEESCFDQYCFMDYNSYITDSKIDDLQGHSYFDKARMV